jgi:hypothetical protein
LSRKVEGYDALGAPASLTGGGIVVVDERTLLPKQPEPELAPGMSRLVGLDSQPLEYALPAKALPLAFTWSNTPPPEWQAALDRLTPPNDRVSFLRILWVAADLTVSRWGKVSVDPVQRWVLFQCTRQIPEPALIHLEAAAPHPKHNPRPLMREQWELYQAERLYGQPFWIVQGERGGHKRRFTQVEQNILKAQKLPHQAPAPGALPYAPLDNRVLDKLAVLDVMTNWNRAIELDERKPDELDAEMREAAKDGRRWLLNWLESQVEAQLDEIPVTIETSRDVAPIDADLEREQLINADR